MELTERESLERSKELWGWLVETGKDKSGWPEWERYGHVELNCFLCEYVTQKDGYGSTCDSCPLYKKYGTPCGGTAYGDWEEATTKKDRKKYAKLFLEVLETL